ncbi:hypothetical protein Tco_0955932 [Tanacetum coccineum]|uniref:Uncharacterized protein n=1 Tax=Tanacetum coccineum TaxID=301880 RepID=A0ABQ5E9D8_9ASTR
MEFKNRIHLRHLISIVCLVLVRSVKGANLSPSSSTQENERRVDEVKKALGPLLDKAKEVFGPISSWDFEEVEEAFGLISDDTKQAFGPVSSSMLHQRPLDSLDPNKYEQFHVLFSLPSPLDSLDPLNSV